ncbi:MAG: ATP-binding protein [Cyanobacteria bacterium P01_D01_bin.156]
MDWPIYSIEDAPEDSKASLIQAKETFGLLPNSIAVSAEAPALLKAGMVLWKLFEDTSFSPIEQQVIYLTVNFTHNCHYCMASHSAIADASDMSAEDLEALRKGTPLLDPKLQALRRFTQRMIETKGQVEQPEVLTFMAHGYTKQQVLEIVLGVAIKVIHNYTNNIAETPLDEIFQQYAWSRPPHIWTDQQLQLVFDHLPQRIFWKNQQLQYVGCNQKFAEDITVTSPHKLFEKVDQELGEHRPEIFDEINQLSILESGIGQTNQEHSLVQPDGSVQWFNSNQIPLQDQTGNVIGLFCSYEDVTERKQTIHALETANRQLATQTAELTQTLEELKQYQRQLIQAEKMSSLGEMMAGIAHEMNNPINFVRGNLTPLSNYCQDLLDLVETYKTEYPQPTQAVLEKQADIDLDFVSKDLGNVLSSLKLGTQRLRDIVSSLRNYSRLDEAAIKEFDIHEGINSTLLILNHRIKHGVEVIKDFSSLPMIQGSPAQLNQVFTNILANALDAMFEADCQAKQLIIKTQQLDAKHIQISFRDNGPGIPPEIQTKIFDPFFTTKAIGKGTGLGLGICFKIIEQHHGKIEIKSKPGDGTTFLITLPKDVQPA